MPSIAPKNQVEADVSAPSYAAVVGMDESPWALDFQIWEAKTTKSSCSKHLEKYGRPLLQGSQNHIIDNILAASTDGSLNPELAKSINP